MAKKRLWQHQLEASKHEVLLAVDLYNRPGDERRLEAFVVHMQIAWTYLLHAHLRQTGMDYWYRDERGRRKRGKEGEPRAWELTRCLREVLTENDPVRCNVEFIIGLRNRIEHRYDEILGGAVAGKCQSLIMNYEATRVDLFGQEEGLAEVLRFPVFLSSLTDEAVKALKRSYAALPKRVTRYIETFDAGLDDSVRNDHRYDFRVLLIQQTSSKTGADVAMRFVRLDELPRRQRDELQVVETIVREKKVPVGHQNEYRAMEVVERVQDELGYRFTSNDHVLAWKHYKARPRRGAAHPERTDARYCIWDRAHNDYLYTDAWISRLVKDFKRESKQREILGHGRRPLETKDDEES